MNPPLELVKHDFRVPRNGCLSLARQEGVEPPTARLEGECSIQLSY
jgi:hypothetical protein